MVLFSHPFPQLVVVRQKCDVLFAYKGSTAAWCLQWKTFVLLVLQQLTVYKVIACILVILQNAYQASLSIMYLLIRKVEG